MSQKQIKILQVLSSLRKNGTETFVMNVLRNLRRDDIKFDFLIIDGKAEGYYEELIKEQSKVFFVTPRKKNVLLYHKDLKNFFKLHSEDYHGIHFHCTSLTTIAPLRYAFNSKIPKRIVHMHGSGCIGLHNTLFHHLNKRVVSRFITHTISCSAEASKWGFGGTKLFSRTSLISNGIVINKFTFDARARNRVRKELDMKEEEKLMIHVGMLHPVKNHKFLFKIFRDAERIVPGLKLLCVGDGPLRNRLSEYAASLGISGKIIFAGHREDVASLLSAGDIFVFPSLHEGFGIAVLEALCSGLPVVASSTLPDELKRLDKLYSLDLSQPSEIWAKKISTILKNNNSREIPEELNRFSINDTVASLIKIYTTPQKVKLDLSK